MKESLQEVHRTDKQLLDTIEFQKHELSVHTKWLEEVAAANTGTKVMREVEHFQNKFVVLKEQLDILSHDVNERERSAAALSKEKPSHTHERYLELGNTLSQRMEDLTKTFTETREEFNSFLSKTL